MDLAKGTFRNFPSFLFTIGELHFSGAYVILGRIVRGLEISCLVTQGHRFSHRDSGSLASVDPSGFIINIRVIFRILKFEIIQFVVYNLGTIFLNEE